MKRQKRSIRDHLQNISIAVLAVTALFLFAQSQLYSLGISTGTSYLSRFAAPAAAPDGALPASPVSMVAPVRVAVTGTYGRYGNLAMTTADPEFEPLGTLLGEVLGSARAFSASSHQEFLSVLKNGSSVYYDFGSPLPLSILSGLMGVPMEGEELFARRMAISDRGSEGVLLYLWDDGDVYLKSVTAVSPGTLRDTIGLFEQAGAAFAMDESAPHAEQLHPLSLFPEGSMDLPVLSASSAIGGTDRILTALNFNPRTNLRYPETDGTEVIVEGERSLRIGTTGLITYQSGGDPMLTVGLNPAPSLRESVLDTCALLDALLAGHTGEAALYLRSARQEGSTSVLEFDYHMDGVPVYFADDAPAVRVELSGNAVSLLTLRFRQYQRTGQPSLLLPLPQALAVAAQQPHAELSIAYVDRGSESVSAQWLDI